MKKPCASKVLTPPLKLRASWGFRDGSDGVTKLTQRADDRVNFQFRYPTEGFPVDKEEDMHAGLVHATCRLQKKQGVRKERRGEVRRQEKNEPGEGGDGGGGRIRPVVLNSWQPLVSFRLGADESREAVAVTAAVAASEKSHHSLFPQQHISDYYKE
ncbi:hypothetical protein EYF80_016148 [Liparis tanakae]|uniref:Uncharacterized protein n=1 Tax=Liparis tanakae TaxID=230148 RepID=A0A4Z2I8W5_9TELE|nr:hypothetical protein EYF80_016148 [Liparis tanakae]